MGKYLDSLGLSHLIGLIKTALSGKQATLVSGTNIKTINNESLLGSGNISVGGGSSSVTGVKGDSESTYRTGNVNLTAANVGAAASSHTHAASDITDTLAVAHGGTGAATASANRVFAGPSSGSAAAPSFRALAEADLPSAVQTKLDTITSTANEMQITSANGLRRLCLTGNNNLRVDTRESTSDAFTTLYYPSTPPEDETTIANIVTQTSTQSTNNPITSAKYRKRYSTVMVEIKFKPAAARSAGTAIDLGTIVSGKRPALFASGGSQTNMARMTTAGAIQIVPRGALSANTEYTVGFTYLL